MDVFCDLPGSPDFHPCIQALDDAVCGAAAGLVFHSHRVLPSLSDRVVERPNRPVPTIAAIGPYESELVHTCEKIGLGRRRPAMRAARASRPPGRFEERT